jgi:predicted transcriptional regulator
LKEVLRLHSLGLSQHQIARSCSISQSTVHEYLFAAQAAGVSFRSATRRRFGGNIRSRNGRRSIKSYRRTRT